MDHGYGQSCTVARAAQALCGRWTPLVVRELLCGSKRFNDLHRGLPRMSSSLLAQRLRHLENIGVIRRAPLGKVWQYSLTEAGEELRPIIVALGHWGARWVGSAVRDYELDAGLLMWDIRRSIARETAPADMVVHVHFSDARPGECNWWLIHDGEGIDLCRDKPGAASALQVLASVRALTEVWRGHCTPEQAMAERTLAVQGPQLLARQWWQWLGASRFAPSLAAGALMAPAKVH